MSHCIVLDVDGEPVRFQLTIPPDQLTDEDRAGLIELVRAVRARSDAEPTPLATPTPRCTCDPGPEGQHRPHCDAYGM